MNEGECLFIFTLHFDVSCTSGYNTLFVFYRILLFIVHGQSGSNQETYHCMLTLLCDYVWDKKSNLVS